MSTTKTKRIKRGRPNANYQVCLYCSQEFAHRVALPQVFNQKGELTIIEDVPMMMCDNCGQSYIDLATARQIDEVLESPQKYTKNKSIKVASFT